MKNVFITGGSRGVGLEIAKRFASVGANIAIVGKTTEEQTRLKGTIYSAAEEIKAAGANCVLPIQCDVQDLVKLKAAIEEAGEKFGHIDVLVNNASSIYLLNTSELPEKRFDLMHNIILRASLFSAKYALPYLRKSSNPHIISLAPKVDMQEKWFKGHTAYTLCKFSASMLVMGLAAEYKEYGIAANAIWPATLLDTAAVQNLLGGEAAVKRSRHPKIVADAVYIMANKDAKAYTGNYLLDEDVLKAENIDLAQYSVVPGSDLITDLYVEKAR